MLFDYALLNVTLVVTLLGICSTAAIVIRIA